MGCEWVKRLLWRPISSALHGCSNDHAYALPSLTALTVLLCSAAYAAVWVLCRYFTASGTGCQVPLVLCLQPAWLHS